MNFSPDSKFFNFMSKLGDFVVLNLVFIITCIPVFTIGASFCALYTVCKKRLADEESYIIRGYLAIWKENFKNATIIWLCFLACLPVLLFFLNLLTNQLNNVILFSCCLLVILWYIFSMLYAFPLRASFINTPFRILCNSFDCNGTPAIYLGAVYHNNVSYCRHITVSGCFILYFNLLVIDWLFSKRHILCSDNRACI